MDVGRKYSIAQLETNNIAFKLFFVSIIYIMSYDIYI